MTLLIKLHMWYRIRIDEKCDMQTFTGAIEGSYIPGVFNESL